MLDLRATLDHLTQNFNLLREREAKYAGNTPLDLLNQISDHEEAIALTRQAIQEDITEAVCREMLKPLLVSLNIFGPFFGPPIPLQRPRRVEHFTDREEELQRLLTNLQLGKVVTLCGPGGIGKTALATEALWILAPEDTPPDRFPDGIFYHSFYNQPEATLALALLLTTSEKTHN